MPRIYKQVHHPIDIRSNLVLQDMSAAELSVATSAPDRPGFWPIFLRRDIIANRRGTAGDQSDKRFVRFQGAVMTWLRSRRRSGLDSSLMNVGWA